MAELGGYVGWLVADAPGAVIRRRSPWIGRVSDAGQQGLRLTAMVLAIAAAPVVPLTLTPVLPVAAAMVVTIASIPSGRGPQRYTLGTPPDGGEGSITGISSHVRF